MTNTQPARNARRQRRERLAREILQAQYEQETGAKLHGRNMSRFDEWLEKKHSSVVKVQPPQ